MGAPGAVALIAVVGATATGKSDLALDLAGRLAEEGRIAEVVGADAMQLYRGMDIGTAKLPPDRRRGIRHHLLDVLEVTEEASVAAYQRDARAAIADILARGHTPVLVGGSGLYVRAVLDRLEIPPTDATVRAAYEALLAETGVASLYAMLRERDPVAAAAVEPRNARRIVRALEVIELTGRPFSATMPRRDYLLPTVQIGVRRDRGDLDRRVDARVEGMWREGLLDEVRRLVPLGLREGVTAPRAIGYAQALAQLDGVMTEGEAVTATQTATRRFVRRQESWFGRDPRIAWLHADAPDLLGRALDVVSRAVGAMADNGAHD
jgi:tRNA dimethylallyltransferase